MKYDDAGWHDGADGFPESSPSEYGGTHIALFMKWCFIKGWAGEFYRNEHASALQNVISGTLSATDFFFEHCDGKLTDDDFNEEGNKFASLYYGDDGLYLNDYSDLFFDLMYEKPESEHEYSQLSRLIDKRYTSGILTSEQLKQSKPWWKFW